MATLLEIVNGVLIDVGERQVLTLTSPTAIKATGSVQDALRDFDLLNVWRYGRVDINATSWTGEIATLPSFQKLHGVYTLFNTNSKKDIQFLDEYTFDRINKEGYPTGFSSATTAVPFFFTILGETQVGVYPYPNDSTAQAKVFFSISKAMTIPTLATDVLATPARFDTIIKTMATSRMVEKNGDLDIAQTLNQRALAMVDIARKRATKTISGGVNLYDNRIQSRRQRRY